MKGWLTNRERPSKMDRQTSQMDHWIDFKNWIDRKIGLKMDVGWTFAQLRMTNRQGSQSWPWQL